MNIFSNIILYEIVAKQFKLNLSGEHGVRHWKRVYINALKIAKYYNIKSDVFELFALLHDSKREDENKDLKHGKRASLYAKKLIETLIISISKEDKKRLLFACSNHTKANKKAKLYEDLVVQICLDADRLDIARVGIIPEEKYFSTNYARQLVRNKKYYHPFDCIF